MPTAMRAKFVLSAVESTSVSDKLKFNAVAAAAYTAEGSDEDNTYAKFSPSASCEILVMNPDLLGKLKPGTKYYVDFTPVDEKV